MSRNLLSSITFVMLLVFAVYGTSACGGGGGTVNPNPNPQNDTAKIAGYIYEYNPAKASDPLLGAPTNYIPVRASITAGGKTTNSDETGYFSLSSVLIATTEVAISATGFDTTTKNVALVKNQTTSLSNRGTTTLTLKRSSRGSISVSSNPNGADVMLNGRVTGCTTPFNFVDIPTGRYQITLRLDGYVAVSQDVTLVNGQTTSPTIELTESGDPSGDFEEPPSSDDVLELQQPDSYTGEVVSPATPQEIQALTAIDASVAATGVIEGQIRFYEPVVDAMCDIYNEYIVPSTKFGDIPIVPAEYKGYQGTPSNGKIDVYYSGYEPGLTQQEQALMYNAFAGYESTFFYENLFLGMDENVSLLFLSDSAEEWIYWVSEAYKEQAIGNPFAYVPLETRDALVADPDLGPVYQDLLLTTYASIIGHEFGHVDLGHALQKARLRDFDVTAADLVNGTALNWPFEYQADIFSAHTLMLLPQDDGTTGVGNTDGGVFCNLVFAIIELDQSTWWFLNNHPPGVNRAYIYDAVGNGANLTPLLEPLIPDLRGTSSIFDDSAKHKDLRSSIPREITPVYGKYLDRSVSSVLMSRTPKYPEWIGDVITK